MSNGYGLRTKKFRAFLLTSIASCLLLSVLHQFNLFAGLEDRSWDFRLRLVADSKQADKSIQLIVIDQASLDYFARQQNITWPWPRALYVPVIKYLEIAGAKGLAFDMIFSESSVHGVADDQEFAAGLKVKFPIVNAASLNKDPTLVEPEKFEIFRALQAQHDLERITEQLVAPKYSNVTLPIPEIVQGSDEIGAVNAAPDIDGVFRHYQPAAHVQDLPILGLPFALYHATNPAQDFSVAARRQSRDGRLAVNFHGASNTYHTQNMVDILNSYLDIQEGRSPRVDPAQFKDAYVFLGVWAPGLLDLRPTPLDSVYRGVEYNAAVLDNLIHSDFVGRPGKLSALAFGSFFLVLAAFLSFYTEGVISHTLVLVGVLGGMFASAIYFASLAIWMPLASAIGVYLITLISSFALQYQLEGRNLKFLRGAFGRYVSPDVIEKIVRDPNALALGGDRRELTIFFSDIGGFTSISERMDPVSLVKLLNQYLTAMTDIILKSGGTLDKYEGDAIIAFWNAPLAVLHHANVAVKAAIECQVKLADMREDFQREYGVELHSRVGMHTGLVSVGNFGSQDRFNYTIIGDAANLASRLEGANKHFGTGMLVSQATVDGLVDDIPIRPVGSIRVVGRREALRVYEPVLPGTFFCDPKNLEVYLRALRAFEARDLVEAKRLFSELPDNLSAAYLNRIEREQGTLTANWSAVWELKEK